MADPIFNLSSLNGENGFTINGIAAGDDLGASVSNAGDVNGDGIDDLIIGADDATANGLAQSGQSYVIFGTRNGFASNFTPTDLNGINGFRINGVAAGDQSGISTSNAGDVNGDGIDDLIIGANSADPSGRADAGESYIIYGSRTGFTADLNLSVLNSSIGVRIGGITAGDRLGYSVSAAGDVNGDGIDDVIVGSENADANGIVDAGQSYVVFGQRGGLGSNINPSSLNGTNGFRINGLATNDRIGYSVSQAGDINGDGIDDLIVGTPIADPNGNNAAGQSYVVFGTRSGFSADFNLSILNGSNGFIINGVSSDDFLGSSVSNAGDVNGDGLDDLIISAPFADPGGRSYAGQSYVVFGREGGFAPTLTLSALNGTNGFRINGIFADDFAGSFASGAGDVNGDGVDDVIIGAYGADPNGNNSGQAYVVFGRRGSFGADFNLSALNGNNGFTLNGLAASDFTGGKVSGAGDVNGDGVDDLIICGYGADPGGKSSAGQTYVVFGVASAIPGLRLAAPTADASGVAGSIATNLSTGNLQINLSPRAVQRNVTGFRNVVGSRFNDRLTGSNASNRLEGNDGNDRLIGLGGNDRLSGGTGRDTLNGGQGNDRFFFETGRAFNRRTIGIDAVQDFQLNRDKIALDRQTFTQLDRRIEFEVVNNKAQAQQSEALITYIRSSGSLFYNANGDKAGFGNGGQFANLKNGLNLAARDFVIQA